MATVREQLDALAAGRVTAADVAADFRRRQWPARRAASAAEAWGVVDSDPPGDDAWELVESDSRLTAAQYAVLVRARERAPRG